MDVYYEEMVKFAKWIGENKIKYDGVNIWKFPRYTAGNNTINEYFSTSQLVEKFLKEN